MTAPALLSLLFVLTSPASAQGPDPFLQKGSGPFLEKGSGVFSEKGSEPGQEPEQAQYRWALTTALTVPQPLAVGVLAVPEAYPDWAYTLEGGWFRFGFGNNRSISDWSVAAGVRYRPFSDWWILGLSFGYRRAGVSVDISSLQAEGEPIASRANLNLNALFFGLFTGAQWQLSQKVALGIDIGVQLAVVPWGDITIEADPAATGDTDLTVDASAPMRAKANLPIPQIALVRFIWYL